MLRLIAAVVIRLIRWAAILSALFLLAVGISGLVTSFHDAPLIGAAAKREGRPLAIRVTRITESRVFLFASDYRANGNEITSAGLLALPPGQIMVTRDEMRRYQSDVTTIHAYQTGHTNPMLVSVERLDSAEPISEFAGYLYTEEAYSGSLLIIVAVGIFWIAARKRRWRLPAKTTDPTAQTTADLAPFYHVDAKYADMVKRLEAEAQQRPRAYRTRVFFAGGLVILLLVAILAAAAFAIIASGSGGAAVLAKYLWPLAALVFVLGRSMWVRFPAPSDRQLTRQDAPELFSFVEDIGERLGAPPIDHLQISDEFNAGIVQHPKFGLFGWTRNYLTIGLPLIKALPLKEFEAVIAHEFGHIVGGDGRFGNWVYRARLMWAQVAAKVGENARWGSFLFRRFLNWYVPWFNAYSFAAARAQEYAADRCAAAIAGEDVTGAALVRVRIHSRLLADGYWTDLIGSANHQPQPARSPHAGMIAFFAIAEVERRTDAERTLDEELRLETDLTDTHPALKDRLDALRQTANIPAQFDASAAQALLGDVLNHLDRELDDAWWQHNETAWEEQFLNATKEKQRLDALEAESEDEAPPPEVAGEHAALTEKYRGAAQSIPLYTALIEAHPDWWPAALALGRTHLATGNETVGLTWIDRAIELNQAAVVPAAELGFAHCSDNDDDAAAEKYRDLWNDGQEILAAAEAERHGVSAADTFAEHGLDAAALAPLITHRGAIPQVKRAWLVRKNVAHFPDERYFILSVERTALAFLRHTSEKTLNALADGFEYPGETFIIFLSARQKTIQKAIKHAAEAPIFER